MVTLADIKKGAVLVGIIPNQTVKIVSVDPIVKESVPECRNVDWTITSSGRGGRTSKG